jgi:hypothetical protein
VSVEVIGWNEYQEKLRIWESPAKFGIGSETHVFHPEFMKILEEKVPSQNQIFLDYLDSFSEFPTNQGIYFCVRKIIFFPPEIWYIGKAGNFRNRWKNHHKLEALRAIQDVIVYCLPLDDYSKDQIDYAEKAYIKMLTPVFNNTSKPEKYLSLAS